MKTPNQNLPFPLSNRKARSLPYMRKAKHTRQSGTVPFNLTSTEHDNIDRLRDALGMKNRQDAIRQCLNLVYASLVRRNEIWGYPQLGDNTPDDSSNTD